MTIRIATPADLDRLMGIYAAARAYMAATGNATQWGTTRPTRETIAADIEHGDLRVGTDGQGVPRFSFALIAGADPTYAVIEQGTWANDEPYLTLHRVASDGTHHGVMTQVVAYARKQAQACGIHNLRIDTHENNLTMQHALARQGFERRGIIHIANGEPRWAYQLVWAN